MRGIRIRLLPLTIIMALMVLGTRAVDLARGLPPGSSLPPFPAYAEEVEHPVDLSATSVESNEAAAESEAGAEAAPAANARRNFSPQRRFSASEIEVLNNLAARREELDQRSHELDMREALLEAAELQFEEKLTELTTLRDEIEGLLNQYDEGEEEQLRQLVDIYEKMKAKDAAAIFDTMDMDVLLAVLGRMREAKSAPILAEMNPARANEVTRLLVERRRWPEPEVLTE